MLIKKICCKKILDAGCHFSSYSNATKQKEKWVFPPADRTLQRLTSHRAYLSSVLRRDALGFIPREKVAGSPVDQPYSTVPGAVQKKKKSCARYVNWFTYSTHGVYLQHAATKGKTGCHVSCTRGTIYGSLHFYLGLSMCFNFTEFYKIFHKCQYTACLFVSMYI